MDEMPIDKEDEYKLGLQADRMEYAVQQIQALGYETMIENETTINFQFNGNTIRFFPYTGWHTGKGIEDGRGIRKLLQQIIPD